MTACSNHLKWMIAILVLLLDVLLADPAPAAKNIVWVTVEGTAPLATGEKPKARMQALKAAERKAVAEALAPGITVETLLVNLRLAGTIAGAIPYGRIVKREILEDGPVESPQKTVARQGSLYRVRIKAGVVQETRGEDPAFHLETALNQSKLKDGDELVIRVRSTKDCYFAMFNIVEGDKIILLLPNRLSKRNFLKANTEATFPKEEERRHGLRLRVHLPENRDTAIESIYILALPQPFELGSIQTQEGIFGIYKGQTAFVKDLIREVVGIPLAGRAEALIQYEIGKNK
jgi:hypothetical protein